MHEWRIENQCIASGSTGTWQPQYTFKWVAVPFKNHFRQKCKFTDHPKPVHIHACDVSITVPAKTCESSSVVLVLQIILSIHARFYATKSMWRFASVVVMVTALDREFGSPHNLAIQMALHVLSVSKVSCNVQRSRMVPNDRWVHAPSMKSNEWPLILHCLPLSVHMEKFALGSSDENIAHSKLVMPHIDEILKCATIFTCFWQCEWQNVPFSTTGVVIHLLIHSRTTC